MVTHHLVPGSQFSDNRGTLHFFNDFDMREIVRMYIINPKDIKNIRGWQAHKKEKKWFYCSKGSFILNLIEVDNFDNPSSILVANRFILEAKKPTVLEITGGYATAFKAREIDSKLMVFSDLSLEDSKNDDYRYAIESWQADW